MPPQELRVGAKVPRGDVVKDDCASYTVFSEQRSSASQLTAVKVRTLLPHYLDAQDKQATQLSAYTQVKMEDVPTLWNLPKSEGPDMWTRPPPYKRATTLHKIEERVVPMERNLYGQSFGGLLRKTQFGKVLLENGWENAPTWECLVVHRQQGLFLAVYVDDIKMARRNQNLESM